MITPDNTLRSEGAAQYLADTYCLKLKTKSLANLRSKGGGPAYFKDRRTGVVYYSKAELDRWICDNFETFTSTSEQQAKCAIKATLGEMANPPDASLLEHAAGGGLMAISKGAQQNSEVAND